jgi:hypothetical protein
MGSSEEWQKNGVGAEDKQIMTLPHRGDMEIKKGGAVCAYV